MTARFQLSICIPTLNRGHFIGQTLDAIVPQLNGEVEVVIVDGGSTDDTAAVVQLRSERCSYIRYIRRDSGGAPSNEGFDRDCDFAVEAAAGGYCWLFTDDDIIVPDAVSSVLRQISQSDPDLLLVDAEVCDLRLERVLEGKRLGFDDCRDYGPEQKDALLADAGNALTFVGIVVVRRSWWLSRDRQRYYGSGFVHVGAIFQMPPPAHARVLPQPLVQIRMGNAAWTARAFRIWMFGWPDLIWSFAGYSDGAKRKVVAREPWHELLQLLLYRAYGSFNLAEYEVGIAGKLGGVRRLQAKLVAVLPARLAHVLMVGIFATSRSRGGSILYNLLVASRYSNPLSRLLGRLAGHRVS